MSFHVQPSVSKNLYNRALTSNGWNKSWSLLRCSSWAIILKSGSIKVSFFSLGQLIVHRQLAQGNHALF